MTATRLTNQPTKKKPKPRAIGRRGGTSTRVAHHRHRLLDQAWVERALRPKA